MALKRKLNSNFNKKFIGCGLSLFFIVSIIFIKFGQTVIYEFNTFLESINIRISPNGLLESIIPIHTIFDISQYVGIIVYIFKIIFVIVCALPLFIFIVAYKIDMDVEQKVSVCKSCNLREKTSYKVNSRFLC